MAKYIVEIIRDEKTAKEHLKGAFLWLYLKNQKALYSILANGKDIKPYRIEFTDDKAKFIQEGVLSHLEEEKAKLDKFFYGDIEKLDKNSPYKNIAKDGRLANVINRIKRVKDFGGKTVLAFFNNMGIFILWKIESVK